VVINRVQDLEDFEATYREELDKLGIPVLGLLPKQDTLERLPVRFLVERLFARVLAGEQGIDREVAQVMLGAMSVSAVMNHPLFERRNKLIITSGDRSDMILAALQSDTSCLVLTNNQMPPANVLSKASEAKVPVLLVPWDTFTTVQKSASWKPC
jgi:BioD-like phosphotransacetylase family protein